LSTAVDELFETLAGDGIVGVADGREAIQDVLEAHPGELAVTTGAGAPNFIGCRETAGGEIEWWHWINYTGADRVCLRQSNRYVSGFSISPRTVRFVDASLTPGTFQLVLAGFDVDGEPTEPEQVGLDIFDGGDHDD
jgi:hypothetical protein